MSGNYILNAKGQPVAEPDIMRWAEWFKKSWPARQVAVHQVGKARVSTVFLGADHNYSDKGPPILYETMVFGLSDGQEVVRRYSTRAGALLGHAGVVGEVAEQERARTL